MIRSGISDYESAMAFLMGRINYERTTTVPYQSSAFKLDRMRRLMSLLGDPQKSFQAVHIAGTKGKGSTAAMTASILSAAGQTTGLYTSPHLTSLEERFAIDGQICTRETIASLAAELEEAVDKLTPEETSGGGPTFFEVTTAMAFLYFARNNVDIAVLEVGLGGRLDSTNVCQPLVCIITSISFDHMRQLGNTLAAIAGEKAGIIKPGVPVICAVTEDEPRQVIHKTAADCDARVYQASRDYAFEYHAVSDGGATRIEQLDYWEPAENPRHELKDVHLALLGRHQAANAAAAIAAINRLREQGWAIEDTAIRAGLEQARCPARVEVVAERPTTIIDVAHNVASVQALVDVLNNRFAGKRRTLIFASSRDKDIAGMLQLLVPEFDSIIVTRYINNPRAADPSELFASASVIASVSQGPRLRQIEVALTPADALERARIIAGADGLICATGSFFLATELRPLVRPSKL